MNNSMLPLILNLIVRISLSALPQLTTAEDALACLPRLFKANIPRDVTGTTNAKRIQKDEPKCIEGGRGHWLKHDELLIYLLR
jgi:hypothetical protein